MHCTRTPSCALLCICKYNYFIQCGSSPDGEKLLVDPWQGCDGTCVQSDTENCEGWLSPGGPSSGGRALTALSQRPPSSIPGGCHSSLKIFLSLFIMYMYSWCICWAQSMDLRNPWIALCETWICALHDDPWIVRSICGLRNSLCAKYRFASDPRLSPRLQWICIAFITTIASIIK